jgi:hypothetical protein
MAFAPLAVHAGPTFGHSTPTNSNFGQNSVFFLAIAICTKASSVLTLQPVGFISLEMSSSMKHFFPFTKLNPNAGMRLRSEILLLPTQIQPTHLPTPADELIDCSNINASVIPVTANAFVPPVQSAENSASNDEENPANTAVLASPCSGGHEVDPLSPAGSDPGTNAPTDITHAVVTDTSTGSSSTQLPSAAPAEPAHLRTRVQHGIRKPKVYTDGTVRYRLLTSSGEPNNLDEALGDSRWKLAMDQEYNALLRNDTWHLVPRKQGANIIDCKWVYKIKKRADGSIDRHKARLVTKVSSKDMGQIADGFTKTLPLPKLKQFQYNLNLGRLRLRGMLKIETLPTDRIILSVDRN